MPSTMLELPVIEDLAAETADDEFELDLRVIMHATTKHGQPQMNYTDTCGCSIGFSCYGTCTIDNCAVPIDPKPALH
jgi:hypothetical protein